MTTKNFFLYETFINMAFGLGLILVPKALVDTYGNVLADTTGTVDTLARAYGAALIGLGVASYMMRNAKPSLARYSFIVACFVSSVLVGIVHVRAIILGFENSTGWFTVLLVAIAIAWSALLISKENKQSLE
jgi:hypothetical protein